MSNALRRLNEHLSKSNRKKPGSERSFAARLESSAIVDVD